MKSRSHQSGFLIIEALIAILVVTMIMLSLYSAIASIQLSSNRSKYDAEGSLLLQEGMEVAHNALLTDWNYGNGTYAPAYNEMYNSWELVSGEETDLHSRFTRRLVISHVCRDSAGEIVDGLSETCPGFTLDLNSKTVTGTIEWKDGPNFRSHSVTLLVFNRNN